MPAVSKKQRRLMGLALSVKRGKTPKSYSKAATKAARTMSKKQLSHFAKTDEKGLPVRRKRKKR